MTDGDGVWTVWDGVWMVCVPLKGEDTISARCRSLASAAQPAAEENFGNRHSWLAEARERQSVAHPVKQSESRAKPSRGGFVVLPCKSLRPSSGTGVGKHPSPRARQPVVSVAFALPDVA